jgi:hypothetical protein
MVIISFRNCNLFNTDNFISNIMGIQSFRDSKVEKNLKHKNHEFYVMFNNLLFQKKMLGSVLAALVGKTT